MYKYELQVLHPRWHSNNESTFKESRVLLKVLILPRCKLLLKSTHTSSFDNVALHCSSSHSCMNAYLAINSGRYLFTNCLCLLIALWLNVSHGS